MYAEDDLLPLSAVADFAYCVRRAALHRIEHVWEESVSTAEGHLLHDRVHEQGAESRGDLRTARAVRLRSLRLGLYGVADVVEFRRCAEGEEGTQLPGARGRWRPFPVEYKRGIKRPELSFEIQLCAQAICLEEMLKVPIPAGALFYGLSRRRHEVAFDERLRKATEEAARGLHELVASGQTPPPDYGPKCERCSLLSICLPKASGRMTSVCRYLDHMLTVTSAP
ncbi:MAG: CRISPR-associated protein Cas4 [Planctomycetes bacterium]|nr:CRISPR-associated protein Cas4 [Planctomycetota bacterium]